MKRFLIQGLYLLGVIIVWAVLANLVQWLWFGSFTDEQLMLSHIYVAILIILSNNLFE